MNYCLTSCLVILMRRLETPPTHCKSRHTAEGGGGGGRGRVMEGREWVTGSMCGV